MKRLLAIFLAICLTVAAASSCGQKKAEEIKYTDPTLNLKVEKSTDKYRNFYQIFVTSFNDSNDDGKGDLRGIIEKLDYLNDGDPKTESDLGIDGIWLTPIMPSPSYHKYDVKNYFDIDSDFGNLSDFDELVSECHKRGIKLIIDLVLNHCSNNHPLFRSACAQVLEGNTSGDARYFDIIQSDSHPGKGYTSIGKGYYYESNFSESMPEWNLNAQCTRDYFKKISLFWLKDHDVDGFRLDATAYYTNSKTDGKEFLGWFYDASKKIKDDVYMVGEQWTDNIDISEMYVTKVDSFFAFGFAGGGGKFTDAVNYGSCSELAGSVKRFNSDSKELNENAINCFFLSNHDQIRSANSLSLKGEEGIKAAAALYMLMPGNSFIYYGEELGTKQDASQKADEYKREPMVWDSNNLPSIHLNGVKAVKEHVPYGGVSQQQKDKNSILNYYKRIIKIKNQNPQLARGEITDASVFNDSDVCSFKVEKDGVKLMVVHNLSKSEKKLSVSEKAVLRGDLCAKKDKHVFFADKKLTMPPLSTAVLKLG